MTAPSILPILVALMTQAPAGTEAGGAKPDKAVRRIEIAAQKGELALGAGMELRITHTNPSDRAWKLERPETSSSVRISYRPAGGGAQAVTRFSLERRATHEVKLPDGRKQVVHLLPPREELEIQPQGKHEFLVDLWTRWTEELVPGDYEAWVENVEQGLKSSKCTFSVAFSKDSVPRLVETAAREDESPEKRQWCVRWLQRIQPDFELKLEVVASTPEALRQAREANEAAIRRFRENWERVKSSEAINALFRKPTPKAKEAER